MATGCQGSTNGSGTMLTMWRESVEPTAAQLPTLKQNLLRSQEAALKPPLNECCAELRGFLRTQLQAPCVEPPVRRRKRYKRAPDVAVSVALEGQFCRALGPPEDLARRLGGQNAQQLLCSFLLLDVAGDPGSANQHFAATVAKQWLERKRRQEKRPSWYFSSRHVKRTQHYFVL